MPRTLLVTGASGQLGRLVVARLLARKLPHDHIVAATRSPDALADLAAQGAEIRRADFDDASSLDTAFTGVDRALIISTDKFDAPGGRAGQASRAIDAAKRAGVKHLLYTSVVKASSATHLLAPDHRKTEELLAASGIPFTAIRNNIYMDYLLASVPGAVAHGKLLTAAGNGRVGYVTRADCALIAADALASTVEDTRTIENSGPESLSPADIARIASELSGKPVEVAQLPVEAYAQALTQIGLPPPVAQFTAALDAAYATGEFDLVGSQFQAITGESPTSLRTLLAGKV